MIKKVFVGNLPWSVRTDGLSSLLRDLGIAFRSAKVIEDRETGQSRGFAFVEVEGDEELHKAVGLLDGHLIEGRSLNANEAQPRESQGHGHARRDAPPGRQRNQSREDGRSNRRHRDRWES